MASKNIIISNVFPRHGIGGRTGKAEAALQGASATAHQKTLRAHCPIVLACDATYTMPLATALRSLTETNRPDWPLDIHVLASGISDKLKSRIFDSLPPASASISWHDVDLSAFSGLGTAPHISKMTYARFCLSEIFGADVSRILFLDPDILVLESLRALREMDLEGAAIGAVLDGLDAQIKRNEAGLEQAPRVQNYFNAGVLLIDLDRWRDEGISERSLAYLARYPSSPFSDQDALNVACDGLWKEMDPRWNFQHHRARSIAEMAKEERGIVHFVTSRKPWKPSSFNVNANYYDRVRSRTRFARTSPECLKDVVLRGLHRLLQRSSLLRSIWSTLKGTLKGRRRASILSQPSLRQIE